MKSLRENQRHAAEPCASCPMCTSKTVPLTRLQQDNSLPSALRLRTRTLSSQVQLALPLAYNSSGIIERRVCVLHSAPLTLSLCQREPAAARARTTWETGVASAHTLVHLLRPVTSCCPVTSRKGAMGMWSVSEGSQSAGIGSPDGPDILSSSSIWRVF